MKKRLWDKKIPTVFAFLIIAVSIWVTSYLVQKGVITIGRATVEIKPENIEITNRSDSSFTVSFTTSEKTVAVVNFGERQEQGSIAYDERDTGANQQTSYYSHRIPVTGLKGNTKYYFSIVSGGQVFQDQDKPFTTTTGVSISGQQATQNQMYGKVILPNGLSASDTLVYLKTDGASPVSTLTKDTGEFMIPTDNVRERELDTYHQFTPDTQIEFTVIHKDLISHVKAFYRNAQNLSVITLSKDYDFTKVPVEITERSATTSGNLALPTPNVKPGEVKILTPLSNQTFVDTRPVFKGTAKPSAKVKITIESNNALESEVVADKSGVWTFRPPASLSPGAHTITIEAPDGSGIIRRITQSFTVFAQGSQVVQTATPSATPRVSPTSIPRPSPTLVLTLTPSPTLKPSPTPTPKASPTPTRSLTPTLTPTKSVGAPVVSPTPTPSPTLSITPNPTTVALTGQAATGSPTLIPPGNSTQFAILSIFPILLILAGVSMIVFL